MKKTTTTLVVPVFMEFFCFMNLFIYNNRGQGKARNLCKSDIKKAYDHVNLKFLLKMLACMGFGRRWVQWIKYCISSVRFSVLINGALEVLFPAQRGLRQGDPLSPFLFIIVMEGLNNMIKVARENECLKSFEVATTQTSISKGNMEVTHLQYADGILIFCDAYERQLLVLILILVLFEGVLGLHINWRKSRLYPINNFSNMEELSGSLGGEVGALPTIYLSMPLRAKSKTLTSGIQ